MDNPLTLGITTSFKAYTLEKSTILTSVVDEISSGITFNLVARQMSPSDVTVGSNSDIVFNYPTEYKFNIKNNNDLPIYSYISVVLPNNILSDTTVYCSYNNLAIGCNYIPGTHTIKVDHFSTSVIPATQLSNADLIIGNLYNPTSTKQTNSFQF